VRQRARREASDNGRRKVAGGLISVLLLVAACSGGSSASSTTGPSGAGSTPKAADSAAPDGGSTTSSTTQVKIDLPPSLVAGTPTAVHGTGAAPKSDLVVSVVVSGVPVHEESVTADDGGSFVVTLTCQKEQVGMTIEVRVTPGGSRDAVKANAQCTAST
jgi:hypothetical protein